MYVFEIKNITPLIFFFSGVGSLGANGPGGPNEEEKVNECLNFHNYSIISTFMVDKS